MSNIDGVVLWRYYCEEWLPSLIVIQWLHCTTSENYNLILVLNIKDR